jgi:hypothetical protein
MSKTAAGRPKRPKTKARLEQLITQWQKDSGQPVGRLNMRIATMMLAGALARVADADGKTLFAAKGGIAMELRMGDRARATRDVDLIMRGDPAQLADLLDQGLADPYEGFTFQRREISEHPLRTQVQQVRIQVQFAGRALSSLRLEIAPAEIGDEEFVAIPGAPLDAVGLDGPDLVIVLGERWQIAQKLHAVTEPPNEGTENPRVRDLIDLQLLETLTPDLRPVRDACERVFAARGQHSWPPTLQVYPSWPDTYAGLATELGVDPDLDRAAGAVRAFISRIAAA